MNQSGMDPDLDWYRDAVFYELPVKSFFDSTGDGAGDFPGLTEKLNYLSELGVTCVSLLPFYPSPWRDDGYDISDYRAVHPAYGTTSDFRAFVRAARERGIRVAAEIVVNHTSDRHPWFQAARRSPPGSPLRDFYVWSESDRRFIEVREPDSDISRSNWTWDSTAGAYYWHRFSDFQPDLNYDNPAVRREMLKVLRFWAEMGVEGLCLSRASYLVERDGTTCEHLPETHEVLKEMRRELATSYPGVMVEAGLNTSASNMRTYFGDGDEVHTAPHLSLAPKLFLSLRQENRRAFTDVLRRIPELPRGCQWMNVLRNHDELALTLATDEERDYMFREYADDERMRIDDGIIRRLAPLVENSRRRIELLFGILFSLPGSPVIYYGDEIGMGDNVYLGGRKGIRTPMQWSADRNGGFSSADPACLYAPPVTDPVYGFQAVNVEAQRRHSSSLFHWMRRLIALRKRSLLLARGNLELLEPKNEKAVAFVRRLGDDAILVVANLARTTQPVELDLSAFEGRVPIEMIGETAFPRIGTASYLVTLSPHTFHWFRLRETAKEVSPERLSSLVPAEKAETMPVVEVSRGWESVLEGTARETLEQSVLPEFLRSQRWFGGKARTVQSVRVADWGNLPIETPNAFLTLVEVTYTDGARDLYCLPLAVTEGPAADRMNQTMRPWILAQLTGPGGTAILHDALADDDTCTALMSLIGTEQDFTVQNGRVRASATAAYSDLRGDPDDQLPVARGPATSSNSLVFFGRRLLLKLFRRLEEGTNPDYEIGRFLTERGRFKRLPQVAGTFEYDRSDGRGPFTLGILQSHVSNDGDGWEHALSELERYYVRAAGRMRGPDPILPDSRSLLELAGTSPPPDALEAIGDYVTAAATLGRRTAEMHLALADDSDDPAFAPEPITQADQTGLHRELENRGRQAMATLGENLDRVPETIAPAARRLLEHWPTAFAGLQGIAVTAPSAMKTRIHGDYHLGQVLWVKQDYVILDFEGEPTRTVEERRAKFSPVRDVAGMLRSYHYAAYAGLFAFTEDRPDDFVALVPWAELWQQWISAAFLREYLATAKDAIFIPEDPAGLAALLDAFMLAKALYELLYELNNRPDWVQIPLGGVLALLGPDLNADGDTNQETKR